MNEETYRRSDFLLKLVAAVVALVGAAVGIYEYLDGVQQESRRPYWERQVALYFDATSAAATLATSDDETKRSTAAAEFWKLYWGPLALVEDREVEATMVQFGDCLATRCPQAQLQQLSLALAHTCRSSLAKSWKLTLDQLKGRVHDTVSN